ncbi:MAG: hypothetical protein LBS34_00280 [Rickettsiales bacterium]|jgi:hypothetical protein|nr:hypothetical protein [Rickettsiales bacterium]
MILFNLAKKNENQDDFIPLSFGLDIQERDYKRLFVKNIYSNIFEYLLTKTNFTRESEREMVFNLSFNNSEKTSQMNGLISILVNSLLDNNPVILRYNKSVNTITEENYNANNFSINDLKPNSCIADYSQKQSEVKLLSYYARTIYNTYKSIENKTRVSNAIVVIFERLSDKINFVERKSFVKQLKEFKRAVESGGLAYLDNAKLQYGIADVNNEIKVQENNRENIANALNLPLNFLFGTTTQGLGTRHEEDSLSLDRTMQKNFVSLWQPIIEKLFNIKISYAIDKYRLSETHKSFLDWVETSGMVDEQSKKEITANILLSNGLIDNMQAERIRKLRVKS